MKEPTGHIATASSRGSALILTVVLTSLLAIVGVLFVMSARIDKMATTATTESRELSCAIDTVLSQIEQDLAADVPGFTDDPQKAQEYYDYPDTFNPWLADLEPYESSGSYYWGQISNVGGILTSGTRNILIEIPRVSSASARRFRIQTISPTRTPSPTPTGTAWPTPSGSRSPA